MEYKKSHHLPGDPSGGGGMVSGYENKGILNIFSPSALLE
jgi:hypothetical protein